jgi:hypothetical protein
MFFQGDHSFCVFSREDHFIFKSISMGPFPDVTSSSRTIPSGRLQLPSERLEGMGRCRHAVGTLSSAASMEDVALGTLSDQAKWSCGFDT